MVHYMVYRMPDCIQKWGMAFATGNPMCMGLTMSQVAEKFGWSRSAISHEARKFCDDNGLAPSSYMKSEEAVVAAKTCRINFIQKLETKQKK